MTELFYGCKDQIANKTIYNIQETLKYLNIEMDEIWGSAQQIKSVKLYVRGTDISCGGKGINEELALASAYGEFMERFLNAAFFRIENEICSTSGEVPLPYETYETEKVAKIIYHYLASLMLDKREGLVQGFTKYELLNKNPVPKLIHFCPINGNGTPLEIPMNIVDFMYGTNGMCAGNSYEEALVQGISEIMERNIIKLLVNGEMNLLDATEYIYHKYEKIALIQNNIETLSGGKIQLYKCDAFYPVNAYVLVYYNTKESGYFVKTGVHPIEKIAIERCFTELLQDKNEKNIFGLSVFSNCDTFTQVNLNNIYRDGCGDYSFLLFKNKNKYKGVRQKRYKGNKEMLDDMLKLLDDLGYSVYIHDVSIESINAYHIIVPRLSELRLIDKLNSNTMEFYCKIKELSSLITDNIVFKSDINFAQRVLKILSELNLSSNVSFDRIILSKCKIMENYLKNITIADLRLHCCSILYKDAKLISAIKERRRVHFNMSKDMKCNEMEYYECLLVCCRDISDREMQQILKNYFSDETVALAKKDLNNNFADKCNINCCDSCINCKKCSYEEKKLIFKKLKNAFSYKHLV